MNEELRTTLEQLQTTKEKLHPHQDLEKAYQTIEQRRQQLQVEEALRSSEAEFRGMFNQTGVGRAQTDPKTRRFLYVNPAFCAITGYTEGELLALSVDDLNHPDDRSRDRVCYINLLHGDRYLVEKRYLRKDGSTVWVLATGNILRDAQGQPICAFAIIQDITEIKQLEAQTSVNRQADPTRQT